MDVRNLDMEPRRSPIPFRVGINEGIVVARERIEGEEVELYTDSLIGCVALAVVNNQHVFMAHVSSGTPSDVIGLYLDRVISTMGGRGFVQVGLAASDGESRETLLTFERACKSRGIQWQPE